MTGLHPGRSARRGALGAVILASLLLLGLAGCSEKSKTYNYPEAPEPAAKPWLCDVWGSGPNDVYIVGRPGVLLHWNGSDWALTDLGTDVTLTAVWGTGANDVYVVGQGGRVYHSTDGTSWPLMNSGTSWDLYDIGRGPGYSATDTNAVYFCGQHSVVRRLSGGSWVATPDTAVVWNPGHTAIVDTLVRSPFEAEIEVNLTNVNRYAISGSGGLALMTDVSPHRWMVGPIAVQDWLNAGWGGPAVGDNWLASSTGKLFRLQESGGLLSWLEVSSPALDPVEAMWGAPDRVNFYFVTSAGDVTFRPADGGTQRVVVVYDGQGWLSGIWGSGLSDIYAVGAEGTVLHWDGSAWTKLTVPLPAAKALAPGEVATDKYGRPLL